MRRSSGYLRIVKTSARRGDNAQLARISFVDDLSVAPVAKPAAKTEAKTSTPKTAVKKAPAKKPVAVKETK